jgi:hypothetical protein
LQKDTDAPVSENILDFFKSLDCCLRELDTQMIIAKKVGFAESPLYPKVMKEVDEMQRIMVSTLNKLDKSSTVS